MNFTDGENETERYVQFSQELLQSQKQPLLGEQHFLPTLLPVEGLPQGWSSRGLSDGAVLNSCISPDVISHWITCSKTIHSRSRGTQRYCNGVVREMYYNLQAWFWKMLGASGASAQPFELFFPTSFNEGPDVSRSWQCIMKPYNETPLAQIKHRWWLEVITVGYGLPNEFCGITPQAPLSHAVISHGCCLEQPQQWMQQLHGHRWQDTATVLLEQNFCLKKKLLPISHGELSLIKICTLRVNLQ